MDSSLTIDLFEQPVEDGKLRTQNKAGEVFRQLVVDRGDRLSTQVRIAGITHGEMLGQDDAATLLVLEMEHIGKRGHRFKSAMVTFTFMDSGGDPDSEPIVHTIHPKGQWALNKTNRVRDIKWGGTVALSAGVGPLEVEAGLLWETNEVRTKENCTKLTGTMKSTRSNFAGPENTVIWELEENEDKKDGIPTFVRAAVLLRRPYDMPFTFTVEVKADIDTGGALKTFFGLEGKKDPIDPVEIGPGEIPKSYRVGVATLDPEIHNLKAMDKLDLAREDVAGVTVITMLDGAALQRSIAQSK